MARLMLHRFRHTLVFFLLFALASCASGGAKRSGSGAVCKTEADCDSQLCLATGATTRLCTRTCANENECPAGWACKSFGALPSPICQCVMRAEVCNQLDDDCDGVIDNNCVPCTQDPCVCECSGTEQDVERRACSEENTSQTRTRTCDGCRYGTFSDWNACESNCSATQRACGTSCTACPTDGVSETTCDASRCVAQSCSAGYLLYRGSCRRFSVSTVDSPMTGRFASVVSQGNSTFIGYYAQAGGARLASRTSANGNFSLSTVESGSVGAYATLATTAAGLHYAYYDAANGLLRYASGNNPPITVDGSEFRDVGWYAALAMAQNGDAHFAYHNFTDKRLTYARVRNGTAGPILDTNSTLNGVVGISPSIAFEEPNIVHVAHYHPSSRSLRYTRYVDTDTDDFWIAEGSGAGLENQIRVAANGDVVVAYYVEDEHRVHLKRLSGNSFVEIPLDLGSDDVGRWLDLQLDENGLPHLALYNATKGRLEYARPSGTGSYEVLVVDEGPSVGEYCSFAFNAEGLPIFAYYDQVNAALKYAELR